MVLTRLQSWFECPKASLDRAYRWFIPRRTQWPWKPLVCKPGILPKHRFYLWIFAHKKLLTRDRQPYIQDKMRMLCGGKEETFDHLFFACVKTKELWEKVKDWLRLRKNMGSAHTLLCAMRGIYRGSTMANKWKMATIAATIYHIWEMRKKKIFEDAEPDLNSSI